MTQLLSVVQEVIPAPVDMFGPIAHDLEEVECVLARSLRSERRCVIDLVAHLSHVGVEVGVGLGCGGVGVGEAVGVGPGLHSPALPAL